MQEKKVNFPQKIENVITPALRRNAGLVFVVAPRNGKWKPATGVAKKSLSNIFKNHNQAHTNILHLSWSLLFSPDVASCCVIFLSKEALRLRTSGMLHYRSQCPEESRVKANIPSWQAINQAHFSDVCQEVRVRKNATNFQSSGRVVFLSMHSGASLACTSVSVSLCRFVCVLLYVLWWLKSHHVAT